MKFKKIKILLIKMFHHHSKNTSCRVRAIHNVAKGPNVNVVVDGKIALSDVSYKAVSNYLKIPQGKHAIAITSVDGLTVLTSAVVDLAAGKDYTVICHGNVQNLSSIALLALMDNNSCPAARKSHVRFIHAAATIPTVDIWANMKTKVFSNVSYGKTGNPVYLPVDSGNISLAAAPTGTTTVVLGPLPLRLDSKKTYTIIATGLLNDEEAPLSVIVSEDNACSTVHSHHFW